MVLGVLPTEENIIKLILNPYMDEYDFFYYGSRVKGKFSKVSDLDILIKSNSPMPVEILETIKEKFDNSSIPYIVHFSDYNEIDVDFYKLIEKDLVKIL